MLMIFLVFSTANAQQDWNKSKCLAFITAYYAGFKTGFDLGESHLTVTDTYKVMAEDCRFELSYDQYEDNEPAKKQHLTVAFNWSEVKSVTAYGLEALPDLKDQTIQHNLNRIVLIRLKKTANTNNVSDVALKIYCEDPDYHTEDMPIYKVFRRMRKLCNKK